MTTPFATMFDLTGHAYLPLVAVPANESPAAVAGIVETIEADLAVCAHLMSSDLRDALLALPATSAHAAGAALVDAVRENIGFAHNSEPLLRAFPHHDADLARHRYWHLIVSLIADEWAVPCLRCGDSSALHPVTGCGHTVCRTCLPADQFTACPTCGRVSDDPFYNRRPSLRSVPDTSRPPTLITLGDDDTQAAVLQQVQRILASTGSVSSQELEHLRALLPTVELPALVKLNTSNRAAKAVLCAHFIDRDMPHDAVAAITTATDVLRTAAELSHQDPYLLTGEPFKNLRRPVRRALLSAMEDITKHSGFDVVAAEALRNKARFKAFGRAVHPGEHADRFPNAHRVFDVLRDNRTDGKKTRVSSATGVVESALAAGDPMLAVEHLLGRPGDLFRRLDHLLRISTAPEQARVLSVAGAQICGVPAPLLFSVRASFARRVRGGARTAVFPKGGSTGMRLLDDARCPLDQGVAAQVVGLVDAELVRRSYDPDRPLSGKSAVIDPSADAVLAPSLGRGASSTRVAVPRGSRLPLAAQDSWVRIFIHWQDTPTSRVDLDLSVTLWDESWNRVAKCDFTHMAPFDGLSHSGDFTSAPAPAGASEYVDLDVARGLAEGARYAVVTIQSYTAVPFDQMPEAFAGIMISPDRAPRAAAFDASAVRQRLDLSGVGTMTMPLIVDLNDETWMWVDTAVGVTGSNHSVDRHHGALARQASTLTDLYSGNDRVSLGYLALNRAVGAGADELVMGDVRILRDGLDDTEFAATARASWGMGAKHDPLPVGVWAGADAADAPHDAAVTYAVFGGDKSTADLVSALTS